MNKNAQKEEKHVVIETEEDRKAAFKKAMDKEMAKERRKIEEKVGIAEDNTILDIEEMKNYIKKLQHELPSFKKKAKSMTLAQLKKEI